jgi:hypothetical protein
MGDNLNDFAEVFEKSKTIDSRLSSRRTKQSSVWIPFHRVAESNVWRVGRCLCMVKDD